MARRGVWRAAALAWGLALGVAAAAPLHLSPEQARADGFKAMAAGNAQVAHEFALALLQRDPKDFAALILRARSARALNRMPEARDAAAAAWGLARTRGDRYAAAMVRAQVLSSSGYRLAAQLWLRRATDFAATPEQMKAAVGGLGYVRAHTPWVLELSASLQPSSNVNGGSANSTMVIFGLPFLLSGDARALSGLIGSFGGTATWRLPPGPHQMTTLALSAGGTHVWLSSGAKAQAPGVHGSRYDYSAIEATLAQKLYAKPDANTVWRWSGTLGANQYGHDPLSNYGRLSGGVTTRLGKATLGLADLTVERQLRQDNPAFSAVVYSGGLGLRRSLGNGDVLGLNFGRQYTSSSSYLIAHRTMFGSLSWDRAAPVAGMKLGAALSVARTVYPLYPFGTPGRHDLTRTLSLTALFTRASLMGFAPTLTLQWQQVKSDVSLYDSRSFGLALGVKSVF